MENGLPNVKNFYRQYDKELTDNTEETVGPTPPRKVTNANGVQQTMRNLSGSLTLGDATKYLQDSTKGYVQGFGKDTFLGSQLPTAIGHPYTGDMQQAPAFDMSVPDIGGANAVNFDRDGGVAAVQTRDLTNNQPLTGNEPRIEGGSNRPKAGSLNAALADKEDINSYMSKFNSNDAETARRAAFLNAPDTLSGMKAVKAQQNMISVGQKDYFHNDGNLMEMDSGDMRERLAGRMSAEDLKNKYVKDITDSNTVTPDVAQNPQVLGSNTPPIKPSGRQTVPLDVVNSYLDNGKSDEYIRLLDSGQLPKQ